MLKAIIIDDSRKASWDHFVMRHPDAIAWHVYDWWKVLHGYYGLEYFPIAAMDGAEVRGILPLYRVRTFRSGTALISIPYVVAGGIVADDAEAEHLLLEEALRLSRSMGDAPVTLKQYRHRVAGDLHTDQGFYNLELAIGDGLENVWNNLSEENRESLGGTEAEQFQLDYPAADVPGFCRALSRHQHAGGVPSPSRRWIQLLLETGLYSVALLRRHGRIVAGTLVKSFKRTASFPYTCLAGPDVADLHGARRLYWELLERLASEGFQIVHSGRIPKNHAVPGYRLGWGGERHEYYYQYYGLHGKTESGSKRGRARAAVEAVWRRMPVSMANLLSPPLLKQYP